MSISAIRTNISHAAVLFLVLVASLVAVCPLQAQFNATVEGLITDPSSAAVPGAEVTVENQATGVKRSVRTTETGYFRVSSLPAGHIHRPGSGGWF